MRTVLPIKYLRECFEVDFGTGELRWKLRPRSHFESEGGWRGWNKRFAGKAAGGRVGEGYIMVRVHKQGLLVHRVVMALATGRWPAEVDHIDGRRANNCLSNLREVTRAENARNQCLRSNNTSGVVGVCFDVSRGKWLAQTRRLGRTIFLGRFDTMAQAIVARRAADIHYGFHPNHGRAA